MRFISCRFDSGLRYQGKIVTKNFFRLFRYITPYRLHIIGIALLAILFATSNIYIIPLVRDLCSEITKKRIGQFNWQVINAFGLWTIRILTQYSQRYLTVWVSHKILLDIKQTIYEKYQSFSQHFYSNWRMGDLLTRLFDDSTKFQQSIVILFSSLLPQTLTLIGVIIYLYVMSWKLTLFITIAVPLFVLTISYFTKIVKRITIKIQQKISNITHLAQETLMNIKMIQTYTLESISNIRFQRANMNNMKSIMFSTRYNCFKGIIEQILQGFVFILIIYLGGNLVSTHQMTGPELISYFAGCALLIDPILAFSTGVTNISQTFVSVDRIYEILDHPVHIKNRKNAQKKSIQGLIEFKNISFNYTSKNTPVLKNINLTIEPGELIAIVGLSGSGKSTLVDLIPRFYDTSEGTLLIDGLDVKDHDLLSLRSQLGMVLQDDFLFSGSILENIRFGKPEANETAVITAAKQANAWEFINNFPQKLQTNVGDQGRRLSGGQRQRIAIARAILKDPKILILDEATSALDSESEQIVQQALNNLMKNRTSVVVAHRLSTVRNANKIIVLDKGCIIEEGTHQSLIKKQGKYFELHNVQFKQ